MDLQEIANRVRPADLEMLKQHIAALQIAESEDRGGLKVKDGTAGQIPDRVNCSFPILVSTSNIPGGGKGIFILENVEAGEMVFNISDPMFTSVDNGAFSLANTCDNCFASNDEAGGATIEVSEGKVRMYACTRCKVLHYCGKECQIEAWNHHHKLECKALKKMLEWEGEQKMVHMSRIRQMVRLLELHGTSGYPESPEWAEIKALSTHKLRRNAEDIAAAKQIAAGLEHYTCTDLSQAEIVDLLFALQTNALTMSSPLLRPHDSSYVPDMPFNVVVGAAMDPFMAMMNHSCRPNVSWGFEGRKLRITTLKPIVAGEELYITYVDDLGDFHRRRQLLSERWSFDCACSLCTEGPKGLNVAGPLGERVLKLKSQGWPDTPEEFYELEGALGAIESAGYGYGTYPLRWFYQCVWASQALQQQLDDALKTSLKLYYQIEPAQDPAIEMEDRQNTLYHLINNLKDRGQISDIPTENMAFIYKHLRRLYVLNMAKLFGFDSNLARYEARSFKKFAKTLAADQVQYVLASDMKALLKWAGVAEVSEKVIMGL